MRVPSKQQIGICMYANQWADVSGQQMNVVGNRPTERMGNHGGFIHGVTILRGGVPDKSFKRAREVNHGIVLSHSKALKPNISCEDKVVAVGWGHDHENEREGRVGGFDHYAPILHGGVAHDVPVEEELNHGTVLFRSSTLKPRMDYEGQTQRMGNGHGKGERYGKVGGYQKGSICFHGGAPRDVPCEKELNHGVVLYRSGALQSTPRENFVNERGERLGSAGGFTHGEIDAKGGKFNYHIKRAQSDPDLVMATNCKDRHHSRFGHFVCTAGSPNRRTPIACC